MKGFPKFGCQTRLTGCCGCGGPIAPLGRDTASLASFDTMAFPSSRFAFEFWRLCEGVFVLPLGGRALTLPLPFKGVVVFLGDGVGGGDCGDNELGS